MTSVQMEIPDVRTLARHVAPRFVESTLVPLVLFIGGLRLLGVWGAMTAGLLWAVLPDSRWRVAEGAALGLGVWAAGYLGWLPATDLMPPITEHTAKEHLANILDKLGLENRVQIATYAVQHGLAALVDV